MISHGCRQGQPCHIRCLLDPVTHMVISYEVGDCGPEYVAQAHYRAYGKSEWQVQQEDDVPTLGAGRGKVHVGRGRVRFMEVSYLI